MAWQEVTRWTFNPIGSPVGKGDLAVVMWYDDSTVTLTSVDTKFSLIKLSHVSQWADYYDTFYLLFNPTVSSRQLYPLKTARTYGSAADAAKWPYDPGTRFTLYKGKLDTAFSMPPFWICNRGWYGQGSSADDMYKVMVNNEVGYGYYQSVAGDARPINKEATVATNGTTPTIGLAYNLDNTVTIAGSQGENGRHNNISTTYIYYTLDGTDPSSSSSRKRIKLVAESGESYTEDIGITAKCTVVKAYIECTFKLGTTTSASSQVGVTYYAKPGNPGKPKIDNITTDFNNRLTVKKPWKISWGAAKAGNIKSPIRGYRFRVYKSAAGSSPFSTIKIYSNTKELLSSDSGAGIHRYYYDINKSTATSMTFYPEVNGIVPGDIIRFGLYAYTTDGNGTKIFSSEPQIFSYDYLVQNAGIVRVKVSNTWKEGQVYVKVNGAWKEAETVSTKVNGTWKESE
jgi:hypothetical protein